MGIFFTGHSFCFTFLKQFTSCLHFIPNFLISASNLYSRCHHAQMPGQDFGRTLCDILNKQLFYSNISAMYNIFSECLYDDVMVTILPYQIELSTQQCFCEKFRTVKFDFPFLQINFPMVYFSILFFLKQRPLNQYSKSISL